MTNPITPQDVVTAKAASFPDEVIEAFNGLIAKKFSNGYANFTLSEAKSAINKLIGNRLWDSDWLNVEEIYRNAGWDVSYDKPGYNESYEGNYTFKKKGQK